MNIAATAWHFVLLLPHPVWLLLYVADTKSNSGTYIACIRKKHIIWCLTSGWSSALKGFMSQNRSCPYWRHFEGIGFVAVATWIKHAASEVQAHTCSRSATSTALTACAFKTKRVTSAPTSPFSQAPFNIHHLPESPILMRDCCGCHHFTSNNILFCHLNCLMYNMHLSWCMFFLLP